MTVGEAVRLMVRSGDGLHGIEIKQFKVKKEFERGAEPVAIDLKPPPRAAFRFSAPSTAATVTRI